MSDKLSKAELLKQSSQKLRGNVAEELADVSSAFVSDDSYELLKFHGSYQGYNRDTATERKKQKLDKEWEFMLRLKMPGGRLTAKQYLALNKLSTAFSNGTLRLTTRQTFQYHNILKENLKPLVKDICGELLTTLGGCGDVVRNVTTSPAPIKSAPYLKMLDDVYTIARFVTPKTDAYADIWMDGENVTNEFDDGRLNWLPETDRSGAVDPLYGDNYMPRKFKIGMTLPDDNCVDVLTNDMAIIPLWDNESLTGYNIFLGGGMGMTHNKPETYPRLASPIAFVEADDLINVVKAAIKLQHTHGDRGNRKHARLKYVVEENGLEWTKQQLDHFIGRELEGIRAMPAFTVKDHMGWHEQGDGNWYLGVPIPGGRIADDGKVKVQSALDKVLTEYQMPMVLTPDQNLILCDIAPEHREDITTILKAHGMSLREDISAIERDFLPCVALPTCGKALAEGERMAEPLIRELEALFARHDVLETPVAIRMTGCPNGCARPYVGDIGIVGCMPGHYALYIGGDFNCTRMNERVFDRVPFEHITTALEPMIELYATHRLSEAETFGDFCYRHGIESMKLLAVEALSATYKWAA